MNTVCGVDEKQCGMMIWETTCRLQYEPTAILFNWSHPQQIREPDICIDAISEKYRDAVCIHLDNVSAAKVNR